jgi:hypothetical protein
MLEPEGSWLRCRGLGRERLVRYLSDYLNGLGYASEEDQHEEGGRNTSIVVSKLSRVNPSVPVSLERLEFRILSTGGGCLLYWDFPKKLEPGVDGSKVKRFVEEAYSHLERAISTGSHGMAKVRRDRPTDLPFEIQH